MTRQPAPPFLVCLTACAALATPANAEPEPPYPAGAPLVWPATVTRTGAGEAGPWKTATVEAILPRRLKKGDAVTVVPVTPGVPPRVLRVKSVAAQPAVPPFPARYLTVIDASVAPFLAARPEPGAPGHHPFDAVVVHPPRPRTQLLATPRDLPTGEGASADTLWAAVDVTGDGKPDAAIFRYCCDRPTVSPRAAGSSPCATDCEAIYLRPPGQPYRLMRQASDD